MQTFLPYAGFDASAAVLDDQRLGKQRVETLQILRALLFPSYKGWKNHPATRMWRGFVPALVAYGVAVCAEWERRGRADAVRRALLEFTGGEVPDVEDLARRGLLPPWLGLAALHVSHRSALVRKRPEHYRRWFPDVPDDLPYLWPPAAFPRWPLPRGRALAFDEALAELGFTTARAGQREAVEALRAGEAVTLRWPTGTGATTTGLLAALCLGGPTLWVSEHAGETDLTAPPLDELRPAPTPAGGSRTSPSIARPPTAADLDAVAAAQAPPDFFFHRPERLRDPRVRSALPAPALVVADGVRVRSRLPTAVVLTIRSEREPGRP